jgi:hypothetical protein
MELHERSLQFYNVITQGGKVPATAWAQAGAVFGGTALGKQHTQHQQMLVEIADYLSYLENEVCPKTN